MFVTMAVLLSASAVAALGVDSTRTELDAAGSDMRGQQSSQIAEAGLTASLGLIDELGPSSLYAAMGAWRGLCQASSGKCAVMAPGEPAMANTQLFYRIHLDDFATPPFSRDSLGGDRQPYRPTFATDVFDAYIETADVAGERSDGHGSMVYLHATYVTRGRIVPVYDDVTLDDDVRSIHERATDAAARGRSGPFQL
jgi:hypothetical protein